MKSYGFWGEKKQSSQEAGENPAQERYCIQCGQRFADFGCAVSQVYPAMDARPFGLRGSVAICL